ncbi:MAG TPA: sigma-70 family RNA polymerase sigma factor [Micromonosporaceae bacterium]|jgi:RNA polymerase sigma-70 factor (ECF subfamily)|nr:sigma-70 family RNA polymerase sigma factor [Micromonosporaceae bacterium]
MVRSGYDDEAVTRAALAAKAGDRAAASAFVEMTQRTVRGFLAHLCAPSDLDDLTQETYLRALRSLRGFAGRSSARTWLLAIARNVAADHVRAAVRRPRPASLDARDPSAATPRTLRTGGFDDGVALRHLLEGLAPDRREAFIATQVLGLSYAEAAEVCGCPIGTIRSRVARAREDLVTAYRHGRPDQAPVARSGDVV